MESGDTNSKRAKKALARGGERWVFCLPLSEKHRHFWNSRFGPVLTPFLVELWRGVARAGEPLTLSTCTLTILLTSERPTLNAYACQILLAQCREIVDTANPMDGSVGARWFHGGWMSVYSGGTDFVTYPPPLMLIHGWGRRYVVGCRGMRNLSGCCCAP